MTTLQIMSILMLLQAFGVDTATLNKVHDILIPPVVAIVQQTTTTTEPAVSPTTQTTPIFGSVPCVDSPVFNFVPTMTEVPYGATVYFNGNVQSSCTGKYLPYGANGWHVKGNINVDGNISNGNSDYNNYIFGETNNGTHATTTAYIVISSMGQSATTTLTLDASN